ncbi:MAG: DUF393 domain-containing protein [Planctomycetota bacterium]
MAETWTFKLFFDADCPYCAAEIRLLRRMNRSGTLAFEDIAAPTFDPSPFGRTLDDMMATMHGVYADGRIVTGIAVFREAYRHVGLGWLFAPTGWPILRPICDLGYRVFARYRVPLGRLFGRKCADDVCQIPISERR